MNEKIIEFRASKQIVQDKEIHPEPARLNIPQWYKDVPNPQDHRAMTIKACKPFLDSLMAGYILKNPIDQVINFNTFNENKNQVGTWIEVHQENKYLKGINNTNDGEEIHGLHQVGGMSCPYSKANLGYPIYKILNPWTIILPKGYSALFLPPVNRLDDRFEILSGIVDSNTNIPTNFPCVFKKQGRWTLEKGTPVASVFPFKKENWKSKISIKNQEKRLIDLFNYSSKIFRWYTDSIWNKKTWK